MAPRGVKQDEVEPPADHRPDHPALAPQFVGVEMFVIELEAGIAGELARLKAERAELDRSAADPIEALEHRRDLGRGHVRAKLRDLLVLALALVDDILPAAQAGDEADPVEEWPVQGPV